MLDPPGKRLSTPKESSARPRPIGRTTMHPSPSSTLTLVPASILNRRRSSTGMTIWPLGVAVDTDILRFRQHSGVHEGGQVSPPNGSTASWSSSAPSRSRSVRGARRTTFRALEEIETVQFGMQLRESQVSPAADLRSTPLDAPELAPAGSGARQEIEAERFADELGAGTVLALSELLERPRDGRRERDREGGRRTHRKANARTSISITQSYFILGARHLSRAQPTNAVAVGQRLASAFDRNAKSQPGGGPRDDPSSTGGLPVPSGGR